MLTTLHNFDKLEMQEYFLQITLPVGKCIKEDPMETRIGNSKNVVMVPSGTMPASYQVDFEKVKSAFKKSGLLNKLWEVPTAEEYEHLCNKGLTVLQWRLCGLYKKMFADELTLCKEEYEENGYGRKVKVTGLSFKEKMLQNPEIAEEVFAHWSSRIGVNHLYSLTLGDDVHQLTRRSFVNSSGLSVYQRFRNLLMILS